MVYGLVMRVKVNGKIKQFGMLDSYGNIVRMTHSEMLKHVRKGDVVNIAPNGDYYIGKECSLLDIPLFDGNMNQIGGINYENFFNLLVNKIYNENIQRELKTEQKTQEEEQKQEYNKQQDEYNRAQKQEQIAFKSITTEEKSDIDKGLEVISKLGSGFKREANKRLNHEKYLKYLEKVEELLDNIDNMTTECIRAKTTSNSNLRSSGETLYSRKMDAITNDAQINHYILVYGVIELRNKIAAYYVQARQIIEKELTASDREFYINRLTQYKELIHRIQELHKETSSILKENTSNKEKLKQQEEKVQKDAKIINNIRYKLTLLITRIQEVKYVQDNLKSSLDKLDTINSELDSLYKEISTNREVLESLEANFAEVMQIIEEKQSELEEIDEQHKHEQEAQKLEKDKKEKEKQVIEEALKFTNETLKNISKSKNLDEAITLRDTCIEKIDATSTLHEDYNCADKLEKLKQTFLDKAYNYIYDIKTHQEAAEAFDVFCEDYSKLVAEIQQSQDIDYIKKIRGDFDTYEVRRQFIGDKDIRNKVEKMLDDLRKIYKARIQEIEEISHNNIKDLLKTLKSIRSNILNMGRHKLSEVESEQRELVEKAFQDIKSYVSNDFNIENIKYTHYIIEAEKVYKEAMNEMDVAMKIRQDELELAESKALRTKELEQHVLNIIAEQPIVDSEYELKEKIYKLERKFKIQHSKLGTIDVSSSEAVINSLDQYKEQCKAKINEKQFEEEVSKVVSEIYKIDGKDTEEQKQKELVKIEEKCAKHSININEREDIVRAIEYFKSKCDEAIEKKEAKKKEIAKVIENLNNLVVTDDLAVCRALLENCLNLVPLSIRQRSDVKQAIKEYEAKCRREASKSDKAKQQDILVEFKIKNKLSKVTGDVKIRNANSEEALKKVRDAFQKDIDESCRVLSVHMFLDESKQIQCNRLIIDYAQSMESRLNEKLSKLTVNKTKHVQIGDLIDKFTDDLYSGYRHTIQRYVFENILKLIHGHFYNERHYISEDTSDYELDLSLDTQNVLKAYFMEAIEYLLDNISEDDRDMLENAARTAIEQILYDNSINGVSYLESKMVGNDACRTWTRDLDILLEDIIDTIRSYNSNKDIELLKLYVD